MAENKNALRYLIIIFLVISLFIYFVDFQNFSSKSVTGDVVLEKEAKQQTKDNGVKGGSRHETKGAKEELKSMGYIIEFKGKPLLAKAETVETAVIKREQGVAVTRAKKSTIASEVKTVERPVLTKSQLIQEHANAKKDILNKLGKSNLISGNAVGGGEKSIILGEYYNTFNGLALDISEVEAKKLSTLSSVKNVYPNYEVKALLVDSVPLIKADQVWKLDADGNNCLESGKECLTGKGVTIGIIDTGVDYTHEDLGGCPTKPLNYNAAAKICSESPCVADESLIGGRDNIDWGNEPNQPNTIDIRCKDGIAGVYKQDESIESISVENLNGGRFGQGDAVKVNVKVYCWGPYDKLNLVYQNEDKIKVLESVNCNGEQQFEEFNFNVTLDNVDGYHVIRASFVYGGGLSPCGIGPYDDNDDVVLEVNRPSIPQQPESGPCDKVIGGYDFVNDDTDAMDDHGHGTHVAATAAGKGKLNGIAPDAKIYAYKVLNSFGSGSFAGVMAGIERSMDPNQDGDFSDHLDIISLSLGAGCGRYGLFCGPDDPMSKTIDTVVDNGVVAIIAAGNSGYWGIGTIGTPGTARKAITVAASDKSDNVAPFSSRGPIIWNDEYGQTRYLMKPDVTAPGVDICAAQYYYWLEGLRECNPEIENHIAISGTSMATPHVSGLAALLLQKNPDLTPLQVKLVLKSKTVDLGKDVNTQGAGRINALDVVSFRGQPAIAKIDTNGVVDGNNLEIKGTASGRKFSSYKLELGLGENPIEWGELTRSDKAVENGVLFFAEKLKLKKGDINVLRLKVFNTDGETTEDRNVIIDSGIGILNVAKICSESPCVADESLIGGRDNIEGGNEPNQPNTIQPFFCKDGGAGYYMSDESIESISVENLNGGRFRPGDAVKVNVKVFCWGPYDNFNLVYRTEKRDFSTIKAVLCKGSGLEDFEFNFNLDNTDGYHVIRGVFEFVGDSADKCGNGWYDDNDDVVLDVQPPCSDSDNGKNYYESGRVITGDNKIDDLCLAKDNIYTIIEENYCENGEAKSENYQCEYGCALSENGVAIGKCNGDGSLMECIDSDGDNGFTKGKVKAMAITLSGKEERFSKTDFCKDNQVIEWTCNQNKFVFNTIDCPDGCEDGACKTVNVCTDEGNEPDVKQKVIFNGVSYYDVCSSDKKSVLEQKCKADNTRGTYSIGCENGCDKGACKPRTCSDIDGDNIFSYGVVTFNGVDYKDVCASSTKITEQLCKPDKTRATKTVICPNKKKCSNGKCLK